MSLLLLFRRRRRGFVYTPAQLDPSLVLWLDDGSTFLQTSGGAVAGTDQDPVGQWQDRSSGGRHQGQATAANRPLIRLGASGLDGKPILQGDGLTQFMTGAIPASATRTHILVVRERAAPTATTRNLHALSSNGRLFTASGTSALGWGYFRIQASGTAQVLGGTAAAWQIFAVRWNGATSAEAWSGGTSLGSWDPHDDYSTATTLALWATSAGTAPGDFDIAAVIASTAALTNAQVNQEAAYLISRYPSLTWTPL